MSRQAKISLMGLSNWDSGLFDLLVIPEGLDKDTFVDNLVTETAELEVLYPNYDVMRTLIGVWSNKMLPVWQHLYETTQYEYDPIENYNRTDTGRINRSNTRVHSGTVKNNRLENTGGGTNTLAHGEQIADNGLDTTSLTSRGNIGVTTTQKMIREEREIAEFNIYDRMIKDFMDRFCIMVF